MIARGKRGGVRQLGPKAQIIKRLVTEALVLMVVAGALFGLSSFLTGMEEEEKRKRDQMETESLQVSGRLQTLKTQMAEYIYALPLSQKFYNEEGESTLNLSREEASKVFLALQEESILEGLKINISAVEVPDHLNAGKQYVQTTRSTINIQMDAFSDEQVYRYMNEVVRRLPGVVRVESLAMTRGEPVTLNDANQDPEGMDYNKPQIQASMVFSWYGLQRKNVESPGGGA